MQKKNISPKNSQQENLNTWCYEVGTRFEKMGQEAAKEFVDIIKLESKNKKNINFNHVVELGCGDGASIKVFNEHEINVTGVDINRNKLEKINNANIVHQDMLQYVKDKSFLPHIFTHHSLEHVVNAQEVIEEVGKKLLKDYLYYAAVPAGDYLHSVHHIVFESAEELLPPNCEPIFIYERIRFDGELNEEREFVCIARKR